MRRRSFQFGFATALAILAATPVSGQLARRPDSRDASYPTAPPLSPPPPVRFQPEWEREIPGELIVHLLASQDGVFALTDRGRLMAFDPDSGTPRWSADGIDPRIAPVPRAGTIYSRARDGTLSALDAASGSQRPGPSAVAGSQTIDSIRLVAESVAVSFGSTLVLIDAPAGGGGESSKALSLPSPLRFGPIAALSGLWALVSPTEKEEETALAQAAWDSSFELRRKAQGGHLLAVDSTLPSRHTLLFALARHTGRLELLGEKRGRRRWGVRTGTDVGGSPLFVTTQPGKGWRKHPERLLIAGTLDGLLIGYRLDNGHLSWAARAAGRISRTPALWADETDNGPDELRIILSAEGSRKVEAFRSIDGASAGALVLEPEGASLLAGPVIASTSSGARSRCLVAWSPYAPAGSRVLSLRLSGMP